MPTLSGLRRRGYTPRAIRDFADRVGITKKEHVIEMGLLEYCLRDDLAEHCQRRMAVLNPLRVVIVDYPADRTEMLEAPNHPQYPDRGVRQIPFSRELYIERDDFLEDPPKRFFRLAPGREVRLRFAYYVTCTEVVKDVDTGEITEIRCRYDPATRGGSSPDGRKVKGTLHWVSKADAVKAEVRLYDRLFTAPNPGRETGDFQDDVNPDSLKVLTDCYLEPALAEVVPGTTFQFERIGYFCADRKDCAPGHPVFNRTVALRDSWARVDKETR